MNMLRRYPRVLWGRAGVGGRQRGSVEAHVHALIRGERRELMKWLCLCHEWMSIRWGYKWAAVDGWRGSGRSGLTALFWYAIFRGDGVFFSSYLYFLCKLGARFTLWSDAAARFSPHKEKRYSNLDFSCYKCGLFRVSDKCLLLAYPRLSLGG